MNRPLFVGIDGGGSQLRVAVVDARFQSVAMHVSQAANPSVIGHDLARQRIRAAARSALLEAGVMADDIAAASLGVAGASNSHSEVWLLETLSPLMPKAHIVPSSDLEIALVGALGWRRGILLLAGTGSAAFGIAADGSSLQVGGWGWILGDEGSGFWMGRQVLRKIVAAHDAGGRMTPLGSAALAQLELDSPRDVVGWLYGADENAARVAGLARLVLNMAQAGNEDALRIVDQAANHLARLADILRKRLDYPDAEIAFAGGLLDNDNALSLRVAQTLDLPARPQARHSPVIGAALLAKLEWSAQ